MFEEQPTREISIRDFLRVIFRRKWILITLFVVSTTVVAVMNIRSPVLYESEARVLVRRGQMESVVSARYRYLPWEEEISSELETVKSQAVLRRGRQLLKAKIEELGWDRPSIIARSNVSVQVIKESNVLAISYLHREPDMSVMVADAVTRAYMEYHEQAQNVEYVNEFFAEEIEDVERQMEELRTDRANLVEQENLTFSANEKSQLEKKIESEQLRLDDVQWTIRLTETAIEAERRALEDGFETRIPRLKESSYGDISVIAQSKMRLLDLKAERDAMASQYTDKYPPLAALNKKIEAIESQLEEEITSKIELDQMDLEMLREEERTVAQSLEESQLKLLAIVDKEGRYQQVGLDLETLEDRYRELKKTEIQTKITQATSPDWRVTLLSPAREPIARNTKDYVRMALAPLFSVVVGLGLVFFVESLDHSIKGPADAEEALRLPVLASLWETKRVSR